MKKEYTEKKQKALFRKKARSFNVKAFLLVASMLLLVFDIQAQVTPTSEMEKLTRGIVVVPNLSGTSGYFVSWRMFGTDPDNVTFDVLRDGVVIKSDLSTATSYSDVNGVATSSYQVIAKVNGIATDSSDVVTPWANFYKTIAIDKPAGGTAVSSAYTYTPNDCSAADVDGDGEYEIILKWDPSNSKDNANSGYTGNVIIDCYKLDGTKLWRVDLGKNIRAGAHYTQFLVYDFDGDGKAEMVCKTAPGSVDGLGNYVTDAATDATIQAASNTADYRNTSGYVLTGPEYLTVFNGETGKAVHTIYYNPNRGFGVGGSAAYSSSWGDSYGNRGDRFLACVAYLDGPDKNPSAVMCRGYYTRAYLWAVNFDGTSLSTKWLHASISTGSVQVTDSTGTVTANTYTSNTVGGGSCYTLYTEGAHNLAVGDVDGDGCDEITYGSAAVDNDGSLLYSTGLQHGDATHLSDLDPDRPGLEFFMVHEDNIGNNIMYGWDLRDAKTGEIIHRENGSSDTGRGMAADIDSSSTNRGFELWTSDKTKTMNIDGDSISANRPSYDFRIYWDGDLLDELFGDISTHNSPYLEKWNSVTKSYARITSNGRSTGTQFYNINSSKTCNYTKGTPNLTADLFGDWREEMILWCGTDSTHLNIFTTNIPTDYRFPTLMHDHVYRMGIAWQNVAYNQPPHLGYYLPDAILTHFNLASSGTKVQAITLGDSIVPVVCDYTHCTSTYVSKCILPSGTELSGSLPSGLSFADSTSAKMWTLRGKPETIGDYEIIINSSGDVSGKSISDTVKISVAVSSGIKEVSGNDWVKIQNSIFSDQINLQFSLSNMQNVNVGIYDLGGKVMYTDLFGVDGKMSLQLSGLSFLKNGLYLLKIQSTEGSYVEKIVKK